MASDPLPKFGFHTTADEVVGPLAAFAHGRTFFITGTTPGSLGEQTVLSLARAAPAHIIIAARSRERTEPVLEQLEVIAPKVRVTFLPCDLSDPDSVRRTARAVLEDRSTPVIDVLINNAGTVLKKYSKNKLGVEMQLATNFIGPFLLTNLLLPKVIAAGPGSRIINLSSTCHNIGPFRFHDPNFCEGAAYDPWSAYGQSKTAIILFTVELARRLVPHHVSVFAVHPGTIKTNIRSGGMVPHDFNWLRPTTFRNTGIDFFPNPWDWEFKTVAEGASTTLFAALDPRLEGSTGLYLEDCGMGTPKGYASDMGLARRVWEMAEGALGQRFAIGLKEEELRAHLDPMGMIRARL